MLVLVNTTPSSETQAIECENTHSVVSVSHGLVGSGLLSGSL